ncbi:DUF3147 family protein [Massilia sp. TS11]|uniref:DUF3147 family protein n=1 Tax=Massilia sp. TS11 TaxID=2908003 RepID=UPI001ED9CE59|nr:DUF3147 family protein [Massilia sp. TS11]MCG2586580.1 DUF3147 family protein [Massilia sp. TS11]
MPWLITKYLLTAGVVVLVSEAAKRSDKLGGLIAALPLVTVLSLVWLYVEQQGQEKIANHAWYTFWYVVPTLPMFLVFPWLLPRLGFWPTLAASAVLTIAIFWLFAQALKPFGIHLL